MAREMYLVGVSEEELKPTPKAEPPRTPRGKWENFWYHYKWAFWGCVFAAVVLTVCIVQAATKNPPDYRVLLVTDEAYLDETLTGFENLLAQYGEDVDGDGTVEVQISSCALGSIQSQTQLANAQMLQLQLMSGDTMLYLFEPSYLGRFRVQNGDGGTSSFLTVLDLPEQMLCADGNCWNWADDPRLKDNLPLSVFPKDLYFGVRTIGGLAQKKTEDQAAALRLLQAFAQDQPTAQPAPES